MPTPTPSEEIHTIAGKAVPIRAWSVGKQLAAAFRDSDLKLEHMMALALSIKKADTLSVPPSHAQRWDHFPCAFRAYSPQTLEPAMKHAIDLGALQNRLALARRTHSTNIKAQKKAIDAYRKSHQELDVAQKSLEAAMNAVLDG